MGKRTRQDLAQQMRQAILESGQTFTEIGRGSGVSPTVVSRFARKQRDITMDTASRIAAYLALELKPMGKLKRKGQ